MVKVLYIYLDKEIRTSKIARQFVVFVMAGVMNTAFGYSIFALLVFLGMHYVLAVLGSTIVGIIFNFFTLGRLVFQNNNNSLFSKFLLLYGILYLVNISIVSILNLIISNLYINGAIAIMTCAMLSFFVNKYYVFKDTK